MSVVPVFIFPFLNWVFPGKPPSTWIDYHRPVNQFRDDLRYHFVLVKEPCVLPCVSMFTTCCTFPSVCRSVCLVFSFSVLSASLCPPSLPTVFPFLSPSLPPSLSFSAVCLPPCVSLCLVLLSEVWSRESYYESLWKVEVTSLLC